MSRTTRIILILVAIVAAIFILQRYGPLHPSGGPIGSQLPVPSATPQSAANKAKAYERAHEITDPTGFINTDPFTLADLVGKKVILVDFWTYSCINCQRTIPYLNQWYAKYKDKGLVIVGVHTPEFEFEKNIDNVRAAVQKFGIQYPVVLDSNYGTWTAYQNQYWPNEYLIDVDGYIVHTHAGEGEYDQTEKAIQQALDELMARTGTTGNADQTITTPRNTIPVDFGQVGTPEMYVGAQRNSGALGNGKVGTVGTQTFTLPSKQSANQVYLTGTWNITAEYAQCVSDCGVRVGYSARQVNIVAGSSPGTAVTVIRDGASAGTVPISGQTLYTLIDDPSYGDHTLQLQFQPGAQLFTFTFG